MYKILIVEDHPLFRSPIKQLLTKTLGKVVVNEAGDAQEALRLVRGQSWDMAILDISLPDRSGTELLQDLKRVSLGRAGRTNSSKSSSSFNVLNCCTAAASSEKADLTFWSSC